MRLPSSHGIGENQMPIAIAKGAAFQKQGDESLASSGLHGRLAALARPWRPTVRPGSELHHHLDDELPGEIVGRSRQHICPSRPESCLRCGFPAGRLRPLSSLNIWSPRPSSRNAAAHQPGFAVDHGDDLRLKADAGSARLALSNRVPHRSMIEPLRSAPSGMPWRNLPVASHEPSNSCHWPEAVAELSGSPVVLQAAIAITQCSDEEIANRTPHGLGGGCFMMRSSPFHGAPPVAAPRGWTDQGSGFSGRVLHRLGAFACGGFIGLAIAARDVRWPADVVVNVIIQIGEGNAAPTTRAKPPPLIGKPGGQWISSLPTNFKPLASCHIDLLTIVAAGIRNLLHRGGETQFVYIASCVMPSGSSR